MEAYSPFLPVISAESFTQAAESDSVVVILLWATWDPTSRSLDAWLQQTRGDYTNLRFYAMDLDREQNWPLAMEWGVMTTPTLACFLNGAFRERLVGLGPEPRRRAKLSEWNSLGDEWSARDVSPGH